MGLLQQFRQLFSKPASAAPDLSFGQLADLGVGPLLVQRQWAQLEATAAALPPDDLTRLLDGLCLTDEHTEALARYQQSGQSELRRLTAGVHATFVAWQIRGGAYAKYLGEQQVEGFMQHLNQAFEYLNQPFATPAYQPEAAARLVRVAMGLSEPELAREAFAHCCELAPAHLQGHLFYFNLLTPKWFGNEEQLERFAEEEGAPALRPLLQAMYVVEVLAETADSTDIVRQKVKNEQAPRLKWLRAHGGPLPGTSLYAIYFNNYLAVLHHILGQPVERDLFLRAIGTHITPFAWSYYGLNVAAVQKLGRQ